MTDTPWLPAWFSHPTRLELDSGHHLRPLRAVDVELDLPAVRGSRDTLWARFGPAWGWPPVDLSPASDLADLERQEREMGEHVSFTYGALDEGERELVGCVYLDRPRGGSGEADVDVSWWVVDRLTGGALDAELPGALRVWLSRDWPFTRPRLVGVDVSWGDWARLPDPV
jgi:hypothetical protein